MVNFAPAAATVGLKSSLVDSHLGWSPRCRYLNRIKILVPLSSNADEVGALSQFRSRTNQNFDYRCCEEITSAPPLPGFCFISISAVVEIAAAQTPLGDGFCGQTPRLPRRDRE